MRVARVLFLISVLGLMSSCGDEGDARDTENGSDDLAMIFISPAASAAADSASGSYEIKVSFTGETNEATYKLYYEPNACFLSSSPVIIAENIPATTTTYDWDLTGIAAGNYCVWGRVTDGNKTLDANGGVVAI